jgi:hypothetical protein
MKVPKFLRKKCIILWKWAYDGIKLTNTGLQMILDIEVPDTIASHFPAIIHPFLEKII